MQVAISKGASSASRGRSAQRLKPLAHAPDRTVCPCQAGGAIYSGANRTVRCAGQPRGAAAERRAGELSEQAGARTTLSVSFRCAARARGASTSTARSCTPLHAPARSCTRRIYRVNLPSVVAASGICGEGGCWRDPKKGKRGPLQRRGAVQGSGGTETQHVCTRLLYGLLGISISERAVVASFHRNNKK